MKPEQLFFNQIKKYLPGDISRIENYADAGTPDVTGAFENDYWAELKVVDENYKGKDNILTLLRPAQLVWHARRVKYQSIIFVIIKYWDAITINICIQPNEYDNVLVLRRNGNTFDYILMQNTIINYVKEKVWFT